MNLYVQQQKIIFKNIGTVEKYIYIYVCMHIYVYISIHIYIFLCLFQINYLNITLRLESAIIRMHYWFVVFHKFILYQYAEYQYVDVLFFYINDKILC